MNSLMKGLQMEGYEVFLLTMCERGILHEDFEKLGIKTFTANIDSKNQVEYYFRQIVALIKFCKKNKIQILLSNLQHANIVSVFAQYFIPSKTLVFRHHFHYLHLMNNETKAHVLNKNELLFDKIINRLSKKIIVPSNSVMQGMVEQEGAKPSKIKVMQYLYDFNYYKNPDPQTVEQLKIKYNARLVVLICSRLIKLKQIHLVLPVFKNLIQNENMDVKVLILDDGPEKQNLINYVNENALQHNIHFIGFTEHIENYIACSDILVHPSITEASNSTVKEMAIQKKVAIACSHVGDFSDYIIDGENGFLISASNIPSELENKIRQIYNHKEFLTEMGERANKVVYEKFSISPGNMEKFINLIEH